MSGRTSPSPFTRSRPTRTCVGCRERSTTADLLRVVVVEAPSSVKAVPDARGRMPGRGAWVHLDLGCLDLAERRRAFSRALRRSGTLDTAPVRTYLEAQVTPNRSMD